MPSFFGFPAAAAPPLGMALFLSQAARAQTLVQTAPTTAAPLRLSLADAVARVQKESGQAQAAQARVQGATVRLGGIGRLVSPSIILAQPYGSNTTGGFDEGVVVTQIIEARGKTRYRTQSAQAGRAGFLFDQQTTRTDLAFAAQAAYFDALRADAESAQASASLAIVQKFADAARLQFQAGDVPKSGVTRSEIEVSRAEQSLLAAQTDQMNRYASLRSLLLLPDTTPLLLTDALAFSPQTYDLAALQAKALQNRGDVLSARSLQTVRTSEQKTAQAQSLPDFFVEGRRRTIDPKKTGDMSVRFGVMFPLGDFGRLRADRASARAALTEQTALGNETLRVARLDVLTAFNLFNQAQALVQSFQTGRLDRAKALLDTVQIGYANGANSALEVVDAQRTYQSEQVEYVRALASWNTARARLLQAVGGNLP